MSAVASDSHAIDCPCSNCARVGLNELSPLAALDALDRLARSVRHLLGVLDELNHIKIEFVSFRENIDTGGPLGRALIVIIGAIAELERNLIIERVRAACGAPSSKAVGSAGLLSKSTAPLCSVTVPVARVFVS